MMTAKQTPEQPGDPSASLLLTSEKAVFCNLNERSLNCTPAWKQFAWGEDAPVPVNLSWPSGPHKMGGSMMGSCSYNRSQ